MVKLLQEEMRWSLERLRDPSLSRPPMCQVLSPLNHKPSILNQLLSPLNHKPSILNQLLSPLNPLLFLPA